MKKFLFGTVLALVLLVGGSVWYVYSNLDRLVEQAIETAGTQTLGTQVSLDGVTLELAAGRAALRGLTIANPEGFSDNALLRFDELSVALDLANLSREHVGVLSVAALAPHVYFESRGGESNIDVLQRNLQSSAEDPAASDSSGAAPVRLSIARVDIEDIAATLDSDLLKNPVQAELGDIHLQNLEGTPDEIARQAANVLLRQIGSSVASAMLKVSAADLKESAAALGRSALDKAEAAGEKLREGLGNLLEGN